MICPVRVTGAACRDLQEIYDWIAGHDSIEKANHVLDQLWQAAEGIAAMPHRGSRPRELPLEIEAGYRQVVFKPCWVIYEIRRDEVVIHLIMDGRRNLNSLLHRRLIG